MLLEQYQIPNMLPHSLFDFYWHDHDIVFGNFEIVLSLVDVDCTILEQIIKQYASIWAVAVITLEDPSLSRCPRLMCAQCTLRIGQSKSRCSTISCRLGFAAENLASSNFNARTETRPECKVHFSWPGWGPGTCFNKNLSSAGFV